MSEPEEQNDYINKDILVDDFNDLNDLGNAENIEDVGNTLQNIFDEPIKAIIYSFVILIALNIIFLLFGIIDLYSKINNKKYKPLKMIIHFEIMLFKYLGYIGSHIGIITFICLYYIGGVFKDKLHTPFLVYLISYYVVFLLIYLLNKT